jgi:glucose uptake protein
MQPGRAAKFALDHAGMFVAAAWGLLVWREYKGASYRVRMMLMAMVVLFLAGVGMVAVAPLYSK